MRQVDKEGLVLMSLHEIAGLLRQLKNAFGIRTGPFVIALGSLRKFSLAKAVVGHVKPLFARQGTTAPFPLFPSLMVEMPLTEMTGRVARGLQGVGDRHVGFGQAIAVGNRNQPHLVLRTAVGTVYRKDVMARCVVARQQASAGGLTVGRIRVGIRKDHSLLCQLVEHRRFECAV